jgi:lipopolysaccharide heptosyltransferase I
LSSCLVVRLSSLGDVLFALAVVDRLFRSRRASSIHFLVEDRFAEIPAAHPAVDEVLVVPRRQGTVAVLAHIARLRTRRFDAVIDLQGNAKSAIHLLALRSSRRIGFARAAGREGNFVTLHDRVSPPPEAIHRVDRFLALLGPLGIAAAREAPIPFALPTESEERAQAIASRAGTRPLVVLHPGTSEFGAFKRWEPARFGELARELARARSASCIVTGGPGEDALVEGVVRASSGAASWAGRLPSLLDLTALLARADLVVAGDTGPLHLANRMGAPVVGLFGPKDPARYGPAFPPSSVVRRADVPCSPCTRRWCEAPACMAAIGVDVVLEASLDLLDRRLQDRRRAC